jgi:hypothetical protein
VHQCCGHKVPVRLHDINIAGNKQLKLWKKLSVGLQAPPPRQLALACEKSHIAARRLKAEDREFLVGFLIDTLVAAELPGLVGRYTYLSRSAVEQIPHGGTISITPYGPCERGAECLARCTYIGSSWIQ